MEKNSKRISPHMIYQNSGWIWVLFCFLKEYSSVNSSEEGISVYKHDKGENGTSLHENKLL